MMDKIKKFSTFFTISLAIFLSASFCFASSCNSHAYRECVGDRIYWYNSCYKKQGLYKDCSEYSQICEYGQCISSYQNNYGLGLLLPHSQLGCFNQSIYWYDSNGTINDLYQTCFDSNTCTIDSCLDAQCFNTLKCDGLTCKNGSDDYNNYCDIAEEENYQQETEQEQESELIEVEQENILSTSFFTKSNEEDLQWTKYIQLGKNSTAYFMISISNNSNFQVDDVIVSVNIPTEISYLGNLKIDDISISGDIVSGVEVGSIQSMSDKTITFEGKTQDFSNQEVSRKAIAMTTYNDILQTDSVDMSFNSSEQINSAALSSSVSSGFINMLKRWYMWIIAGAVLVALFVAIFKRLSSSV